MPKFQWSANFGRKPVDQHMMRRWIVNMTQARVQINDDMIQGFTEAVESTHLNLAFGSEPCERALEQRPKV